MPTPAERRALLFLASVCALGAGVRAARAVAGREPVPAAAERALVAQQAAIDRAGARQDSARRARAAARAGKGVAGPRRATAPPGGPRRAGVPIPIVPARPAERVPPVDVDRATVAELEALPRVGPALARRIVADRDSLGPFGSLAGLDRVRGVGPALLRELGAHVTFSGTPRPSGDPPGAPRPARGRRPRGRRARRAAAPDARADRRPTRPTPPPSRAPPPWPFRQPPPPNASATC